MAEVFTGKLSFDKGKWKIVFFDDRKQKDSTLFCQKDMFSADFAPKEDEETEVHFERDATPQRSAIRVRAKDTEWKGPASKTQAAQGGNPAYNAPQNQRDHRHGHDRPRQYGNQTRRENVSNTNRSRKREFHNPYNFVPALPRKHIDGATNELGDREPSGHDRFLADKFSGRLCVRMEVVTPLLLPDTARVEVTERDTEYAKKDHKTFAVRVDEAGKPVINPTAIKGMLRSAYEAITNSRLSVFKGHDERLAFRGQAKMPVAARIEMHKGSLHIRKFRTAAVLVRYRKHWRGEKDKLEKDDDTKTPAVQGRALKFSGATDLPQHGQAVWVKISDRMSNRGKTQGKRIGEKVDEIIPRTIGSSAPSGFVAGWTCITGANTKDKVYERVFVESASDDFISVTDEHRALWKELISNYQKIHEEDLKKREMRHQLPTDYLGDSPGETAWSRQIYNADDLELNNGALCYLIEDGKSIKALLPVMISRILYPFPPQSLLPPELHPAYKMKELSPADRVFGWIRHSDKEKNRKLSEAEKNLGAHRGQLRIGFIECKSDKADAIKRFNQNLPLQILGQPKPQQGRFYVAQNQCGEAQTDGLSTEEAGYKNGKGLRGRKVYPHHNTPEDYWQPNKWANAPIEGYYQEYRRPDGDNQRDNQNRSIQGWVAPPTEFEFDIHFVNLSDVELGALLWLLKLEPNHCHRFGGGKPLGFGSVRLDLVPEKSEIQSGKELAGGRYASLDEVTNSDEEKTAFEKIKNERIKTITEAFQSAVAAVYGGRFDEAKFIKSFLKAACGFDKPIHYPRIDRESKAEGESFKWFVENNRQYGPKLALPNIYEDEGFPLKPED
ncbi:MAG TPA: TIGR03986 family CRISPR-associated RAMP protein [Pyrinomonadaceae bacterium]|jgi:CRISPR-associated protein (TIGR03986 family)